MRLHHHESRDHLAHVLRQLWFEVRVEYKDAGAPFGPSNRAFELWVMYGQFTTCN